MRRFEREDFWCDPVVARPVSLRLLLVLSFIMPYIQTAKNPLKHFLAQWGPTAMRFGTHAATWGSVAGKEDCFLP